MKELGKYLKVSLSLYVPCSWARESKRRQRRRQRLKGSDRRAPARVASA